MCEGAGVVGEGAEGQAGHPPAQLACVTVDDTPVLATTGGDFVGPSFSARQAVVRTAEGVVAGPPVLGKEAGALRLKEGGGDVDAAALDSAEGEKEKREKERGVQRRDAERSRTAKGGCADDSHGR